MAWYDIIIDPVMDWWSSGDAVSDVIGVAGDVFFGDGGEGGGGQQGGQKRPLRTRFDEGRFQGGNAGPPGTISPPSVHEPDTYLAMRDQWRARLMAAQRFADTSDEVIRAPTGTQARRE